MTSQRKVLQDYLAAISGSAGRLVFSLAYFVLLANTLSIAEFGLFATASAAGVMLSRILALGFTATLYRIATVKPRLLGTYAAGFLLLATASLPLLGLASAIMYLVFFAGDMAALPFALIVAAEALLWRLTETVIIVNNGLNRFARGASLVIIGVALRALAAGLFVLQGLSDLMSWSLFYLAANALALVIALAFFWPRQRLRLRPALYWRRLSDSLYVAGGEILFYLQMELDKLLVLALGGPQLAGIYAMIMRLVDLTAIPIRSFSMLLVQRMMRAPELLSRLKLRIGIEWAIFAVSTLALLALAVLLLLYPTLLGRNVAEAAPLVILALAVPGLRNLTEYQAELLFARGQTLLRAINLALLACVKAAFLSLVLMRFDAAEPLVLSLNGVFAAIYLVSAMLTYSALRRPAKRV
ncbi:lipopolysaccharide biosynthesis protein [Nitratireductor pacificus]|uniref:Polysaccharide biosynthesis protein n=1 Tax=Nitratireductor pacificus pht-3B TaxID=391937 RepID=K2N8Y1_9HYPH|nr:lipopolysaccharide biosynthesis protein [Nitratireductor pacificus]EKF20563.1 polysaccharide biosynthesis protein [Nitratireductor pacificus pht-3B]